MKTNYLYRVTPGGAWSAYVAAWVRGAVFNSVESANPGSDLGFRPAQLGCRRLQVLKVTP